MPIYEYQCQACRQRLSVFRRRIGDDAAPVCPHCQGQDVRRLISRFAVVRSVSDAFDDSDLAGLDSEDPREMARWARRMSEEMGEDLGPDFDQELNRLEGGDDAEALDDGMAADDDFDI